MRCRFSLLILLGAVVVVGAVLGLVGRHMNAQHARGRLKTLGALVDVRDFQRDASYQVGGRGEVFVVDRFDVSTVQFDQMLRLAGQVSGLAGISIVDSPPTIDIFRLTGFRGIRLLELSGPVQVGGIEHLPQFQRLQQLMLLHNPNVNDTHMLLIAQCRGLRSLDISGTAVSDGGVETLLSNLNLRELRLRQTGISPQGFMLWGGCDNLKILDVSRSHDWLADRPDNLDAPCYIKRLYDVLFCFGEFRRFDIGNVELGVDPERVVDARFPAKLEWLDAGGWEFSNSATRSLTRLEALEFVNLAGHKLDDDELELLSRCSALRRIGLADTNVDDESLLRLVVTATGLDALDIRGTAVTVAGIERLCNKPTRLYLDVGEEDRHFSMADLEAIIKGFSSRELCVECSSTTTRDAVKALADRYPQVRCQIRVTFSPNRGATASRRSF